VNPVADEKGTARDRIAATLPPERHHLLDLLEPAAFEVFEALDRAWPGRDSSWPTPRFSQTPLAAVAADFGDAELRAMGLWAQLRRHGSRSRWCSILDATISALARRKLAWRPEEVEVLWESALTRDTVYRDELRLPVAATGRLDLGHRRAFVGYLRQAIQTIQGLYFAGSTERVQLQHKIEELLASVEIRSPRDEVADLIRGEDAFAAGLRADLVDELTAPGIPALLRHWGGATASRPPAAWTRRSNELSAAAPSAAELVRTVLGRVTTHREQTVQRRYDDYPHEWTETVYLDQNTAVLLRGMLWSLESVQAEWVVPLLGDVAVAAGTGIGGSGANARNERVANSAVWVLGRRPEEAVVAQLARVQAKVRKRTILAEVDKALKAVGAHSGLTPEQLLERGVPTFGFGPDGVREEQAGEHTALLTINATGAPVLRFRTASGRVVGSVPKAVRERHAELLAELRTAVKELKQMLPVERARVEGALADGRTWAVDGWRSLYLDHPITGVFGRGLLWECSSDGGTTWTVGWPTRDGGSWWLANREGRLLPRGPKATIRLWHPIRAASGEVRAWREWLVDAHIGQPFKQAYREVYLLTPAEEATGSYSNRFAAHVLKYGQAKALLATRGWAGLQLGYWDGGWEGQAEKELYDVATGTRWRAQFYLDLIENEGDGYETPSYCSSDQVRFHRRDGAVWQQATVMEVPALVLSEALRDVDLAVGVASIAGDPTWRDRGDARHLDYWTRWSFGELTESANIRREALAKLMPRTKIADRVELSDRFLRVRGDLRTYKIHLGSGNILMEPNDAYLCIVTARDGTAGHVFLPFEEDGGLLSVIVSKAFLLADDTAITDPTIVRQIRG
jgi:hypothetical protein